MRAWILCAAAAVVASGCGLQLDAACDTRCRMAITCNLFDPPMSQGVCTAACETAVGGAAEICQASWVEWISCSTVLSCSEMRDMVDLRSCQTEAFHAITDCQSDGIFGPISGS